MSRHRQPEDEAPADVVVDPPTGPLTLPPAVVVPRQRPAAEPGTPTEEVTEEAAEATSTRHSLTILTPRRVVIAPTAPADPLSGLAGAPGAITDPVTPRTGIPLPAEVRREWADAPGSFARMGAE